MNVHVRVYIHMCASACVAMCLYKLAKSVSLCQTVLMTDGLHRLRNTPIL